jgi:Animal haem peroxidase
MFPSLPAARLRDDAIEALLPRLHGLSGDNKDIPAGYTYLGQYIDHDITFDPTSKLRGDHNNPTPDALVDYRTPRFDLDSLYGSGPADQPFLYDWSAPSPGVKLLVGTNVGDGSATLDLPRNEQGRALIGDARNDENLIISQLHLLFIRFHNAVVDQLRQQKSAATGPALLAAAQRIVRWHYQWIVVHDFLERVVGVEMAHRVLRPGARGRRPMVRREYYKWESEPFIPVEFSGAAYRFGHSMVRGDYTLNRRGSGAAVPIFAEPGHAAERESLHGFRPLPVALTIDWGLFYELPGHAPPQHSRRIDTNIATRLSHLPAELSAEGEVLARRNLQRGRALRLPSGSDVATAMHLTPLSDEQLLLDNLSPTRVRDALLRAPPLWYYVLCEAASELGDGGRHLGPVGGRIVAEVLVGLLQGDPRSYLHRSPPWTPELPRADPRTFAMADLVHFTVSSS